MLKYLTHKLRTQSINDENQVNEKIDGHDSGTESDGDLEQEDDLIQEHEMELSLSSRQDTVSPTDTACSSESPAFLGPSSSHLLLYDQNSSEEELEVINGSAGDVGSCAIEVGSVSGVPSRLSGGVIAGILPIMAPHVDDDEEDDEEEEDDDATEDIVDEEEEEEDEEEEEGEEVEHGDYASPATAATPTAMGTTASTIIESTTGAMDTSSSTTGSSMVRGQFMAIGNACDDNGTEPLDDFAEELSSLTGTSNVALTPSSVTKHQISTGAGKRMGSVSSLLEKRKRSLAHNSDDEVRYLLEQQQQQPTQQQQQQQQQTHHHPLSHQYHHHQHHHHHHHHSMRQQHHHQEQQLHHQDELLQAEETPLSAPVNFRTSPPLEALKPHRGHIMQRSTTPLVLSEGTGTAPTGTNGLLPTTGSSLLSPAASSLSSLSGTGISGFYGTGSNSSGVNGGSAGGLRFGLVRRPIGCDSPLTAVCHRNSTNPPPYGGGTSSLGSGLSTTTRTSSSSTPSSLSSAPASLVRLGASTGSPEPSGGGGGGGGGTTTLVTNMDISRSVSPPAKMFHCAVSPRRRQSRHQQQRLQRPHRPCLDFDKMQQLKARSVTTWRHSNEHSGELSVFCW
ncbi:lateral signaling target protein 2 homolog [Anopheles marshallii]|uniref:lateral signaling target protein 2 homolog n=1 Tax=Anopheles marshallii TaxID=1521116 RepID=UPI00237B5239|nr:lateral signaling target protein 2 homolog [Anopheles marshallii]